MFKSKTNIIIIYSIVVTVLLGYLFITNFTERDPELPDFDRLVSACAIVMLHNAHAGTGFFVEARGANTNTYFVTAKHVIDALRQRWSYDDGFSLRVCVRDQEGSGCCYLNIPCMGNIITDVLKADVAMVKLGELVLGGDDHGVVPMVVELGNLSSCRKRASTESVHCGIATTFKLGQPLFALQGFPRVHYYGDEGIFTIFYRTGTVAKHVCTTNSTQHDTLFVDCRSFKGASGSPVFTISSGNTKYVDFDLAGIMTVACTARGYTGEVENASYSALMPASVLLRMLAGHD